jgi:hypothetical protein
VITVVPVTLEMLAFCNNCVSAVVFEKIFFIFEIIFDIGILK